MADYGKTSVHLGNLNCSVFTPTPDPFLHATFKSQALENMVKFAA
jgi:hypothetical protein